MARARRYLLVFSMLVVGVGNLFATYCGTISSVSVCWYPPVYTNSGALIYPATCSSGSGMSPCGSYYTLSGAGWNQMNGGTGWHNWDGVQNVTTYLNGLSTLSFSLNTSDAGLYACPSAVCSNPSLYRNPSSDNGYFLSTADRTNTNGITITFPSGGVKGFTMYWGSVDAWNTVTLTDGNGAHTITGTQLLSLCTSSSGCPAFVPSGNNTASFLVQFTEPSGGGAWTQAAFSSCGTVSNTQVCYPAFEFDNLEWKLACYPSCPGTAPNPPGSAPTPEPCSLTLLGSALTGVIWRVRRGKT